jgi:hypothetical protein
MDLIMALKGVYFDDIKAHVKPYEYRLRNEYWTRRLVGRSYDRIILTRGYPRSDDHERRLILPWKGYIEMTLQHPHFGPDPVEVFAIDVQHEIALAA